MSKSYLFYVVNAFANQPFYGNPAGVFPSAKGLSDEQMQAIAKQLNLVETVFVLPATEQGIDFQLRYFTPHQELPLAGHPTVATWSALASGGHIDLSNKQVFQQQTKRGIQTIELEQIGESVRVLMQQPEPKFLGVVEQRSRVAEIFSLKEEDLLPGLPVEAIDTGLGHIVFGVNSLDALMRVRRNIAPLKQLCAEYNVAEAQIYCEETYDAALSLHTRNICPREGIEDPACGVGNSALLAYLMKNKVYSERTVEINAEQGHVEKMPSTIYVRGSFDNQGKIALAIGGTGVLMVKGEFFV
ncbi:PhzF family phenazine biosynthesis protein [bacterium]|nr:PhzF family phenazine biosynthesis protein [bacterium]